MKREFKIGDRVRIYWSGENLGLTKDTIVNIDAEGNLVLLVNFAKAHPKQCRHLKPNPKPKPKSKRVPKEIWVPKEWNKFLLEQLEISGNSWLELEMDEEYGPNALFTHFREVLPKKKK
jgi:hypothetical protein